MSFQPGESGNRKGRRPGSKNKRTLALEAVRKVYGDEGKFWESIATQAKEGDAIMVKELATRLQPPLKAKSQTIKLDLPEYTKMEDLAPVVMEAIADGELPPDDGATLMTALLQGSKLQKLCELEDKVNLLLEAQNGRND